MALLQLDTAHSHIPDLTNERQHPAPLKYATGSALLQASFVLELALVTSSCNNTIGTVSIGDTFCRFSKHFFASSIGSWKHHYQYHFLCDTTTTGTTETNCLPLPGIMSFRLTSNCQQEHNQSNRTIGTRVTYHAYCYGCNDEHTSILPTVPVPNDYWETLLIQLYWKSTNINNTTSQLTSAICIKTYSLQFYSRNLSACTSCTKAMLHLPTVENSGCFRDRKSVV